MGSVPTIDLTPWFDGTAEQRAAVADQVDQALQSVGFFMITGHGVSRADRAAVRIAAREFFALPDEVKQTYAVTVGGRGWLPPGVEANGYSEGTETPPDLKESYSIGADDKTGIAEVDDFWFAENVWPAEVPALEVAVQRYLGTDARTGRDLADHRRGGPAAEPRILHRQDHPLDAHDEHQLVSAGRDRG